MHAAIRFSSVCCAVAVATFSDAAATWSRFIVIRPADLDQAELVRYPIVTDYGVSHGGTHRVTIAKAENRGLWLVMADRPLADKELDFRYHLWCETISEVQDSTVNCNPLDRPAEGIRMTELLGATDTDPIFRAGQYAHVSATVDFKWEQRTGTHLYLYYDYPSVVMDGGLYGSIDLSAFAEKIAVENGDTQ